MEQYVVPFYGFNEDVDSKERLGSAFLVRPNFLITAGHLILDNTGKKYQNKGFLYNNQFLQLPVPFSLKYVQEYSIKDKIYYDLAIYSLDIEIHDAFILSSRDIAYNQQYTGFGYGESEKNPSKNLSQFEVTISFSDIGNKMFDRGRWIQMVNCFQLKETLSPGDSGSPIFTNQEVIGMIVYGIKDSQTSSPKGSMYGTVAIKASFIKETLDRSIGG